MKLTLLSDPTSQGLEAALRGLAARHLATAHNLANLDTPGFARVEVDSESALAAALARGSQSPQEARARLAALAAQPRRDRASPARADGNNVDVDREMVALAQNALRYRAAAELLAGRLRMLRIAISEGRR